MVVSVVGAGPVVISLGAGGGISGGVRIGGGASSMIGLSALLVEISSCWIGGVQLYSCGRFLGGWFGGMLGVLLILWKPWYVRMLRVLATDWSLFCRILSLIAGP